MENIIDLIPNANKLKWLGIIQTPYTIVVTDQRTIFAKVDHKMVKEIVAKASEEAKAEGKGFFGRIKAQMSASAHFAERYRDMPTSDILAEQPENFAIPHGEIVWVKPRYTYQTTGGDDDYEYRNESTIKYKTANDTYKFKCRGDIRKLVKSIYEGKVKVK